MDYSFNKSFDEDQKKLPKQDKKKISKVLDHISSESDITNIPNCIKILDKEFLYRIRIGDYRILCYYLDNKKILLDRVIHRKELERILKKYI